MPFKPPADAPRCAVVDLGSNSVRLVVYEGPAAIRWRSSTRRRCCGSAAGCRRTGRLNEEGMAQALTVLHRYHAVARAMGAEPFEILATAAVRDARNGAGLRRRIAGAPAGRADPRAVGTAGGGIFRRWACCAAFPTADGILADIGGGSLELVRLDHGARGVSQTLQPRRDPAGGARRRRSGARACDCRGRSRDGAVAGGGRQSRPLSGRWRMARPGTHPHGADRLSAADGASLHDRPRGGARPDRRDRRCRPPRAGAAAGAVAPAHR